jgi:hypothetical protein
MKSSIRVLMVTLLATLIFGTAPARAIAPGAPTPGGSFDQASYLGFTGVNASVTSVNGNNLNGIKLSPSAKSGYYFYFYLIVPTNVSFNFYTNQTNQTRGYSPLRLYNSKRAEIKSAGSPTCKPGLCTAALTSGAELAPGAYFLWVNFTSASKSADIAYLTWTIAKLNGTGPASALTWYNQEDLYGQIPTTIGNHWYKVNLAAGATYKLKLWGTTNKNLNVYVYSDTSTSKPIASAVSSGYPKILTITVPSRAKFVYVRVENANNGNAEYAMLVTR